MNFLYTKMKIFRFKEKIDSLPETSGKILPPIHIRIKPTNICNHSCYYCAYRADNLQLGKDMVDRDYISREKMAEIIDDMEEMSVKAVTFSGGGEPFCYPYLLESIKRLSMAGIKFAALTHGGLLQGEIAEFFAHNGTWIRISMDGWDDESYSSCRGVPKGEFTRVVENIKNFKRIGGKCLLGIVIVTNRENHSHIFDMMKKLKDAGADSVKIAPCIMSNTGVKNNEYHKPIFNKVKEQIARALSELSDNRFEVFDSYYEQLETFKKNYIWCPYLQINPVIGADLNVYPCHDKAYNFDEGLIGSIKDMRFKDFWFSDKGNFFKIDPSKLCNHHCMVNEKNKFILEYLNANKEHLEFV